MICESPMATGVSHVADGKSRYPCSLRLLHALSIGEMHGGNPDSILSADLDSARSVFGNRRLPLRIHVAVLELLHVLQNAHNAMTLNATEAGINQMLGDQSACILTAATRHEYALEDTADFICRYENSRRVGIKLCIYRSRHTLLHHRREILQQDK